MRMRETSHAPKFQKLKFASIIPEVILYNMLGWLRSQLGFCPSNKNYLKVLYILANHLLDTLSALGGFSVGSW